MHHLWIFHAGLRQSRTIYTTEKQRDQRTGASGDGNALGQALRQDALDGLLLRELRRREQDRRGRRRRREKNNLRMQRGTTPLAGNKQDSLEGGKQGNGLVVQNEVPRCLLILPANERQSRVGWRMRHTFMQDAMARSIRNGHAPAAPSLGTRWGWSRLHVTHQESLAPSSHGF